MKDAHKEIFSDPVAHARRLKEERYAIIGALFLAICIFCVVFIIL